MEGQLILVKADYNLVGFCNQMLVKIKDSAGVEHKYLVNYVFQYDEQYYVQADCLSFGVEYDHLISVKGTPVDHINTEHFVKKEDCRQAQWVTSKT